MSKFIIGHGEKIYPVVELDLPADRNGYKQVTILGSGAYPEGETYPALPHQIFTSREDACMAAIADLMKRVEKVKSQMN